MKEMVFKFNSSCYAKEITIRRLPESVAEKEALTYMLYRVESTKNLGQLIDEMIKTKKDYTSIIVAIIATDLLTEELYNKIYSNYKDNKEVKRALLYTMFGKNPIPMWMAEEITP